MLVVALGRVASADGEPDAAPTNDGYCDYVQGVASAQSALLFAPTVFGQFGLIEQAAGAANPDLQSGGLRIKAVLASGEPAPDRSVVFDVLNEERDQAGNRIKVISAARPGLVACSTISTRSDPFAASNVFSIWSALGPSCP